MKCLNYNKPEWKEYGILALRVILGIAFLIHGVQKFGALQGTADFFTSVGIPMAGILAPLVAAVETLGGAALILGVFTCGASILLGIVMLVAIFTVHISNGFGQGGVEYPLVLLAALFTVYTAGPGAYALASRCCKDNCADGSCGGVK